MSNIGDERLLEHSRGMSTTEDGTPMEQSRGMLMAPDGGPLEHHGGLLKPGDSVRVKWVVNDLVPYSKLQMLDEKPIGSGAVGDVYRAVHKDWGCHVAYKKLDVRFITGDSRIKDLKNEAEIHHLLRHPHIASLLGVVFEQNNYGLVLEYLPYGSLEEFLTNIKDKTGRSFSVPWKLKLKMACDVCSGMSYLHTLQSPIIHGDLKIQNLLMGDHLIVKISDFGLSKWKDFERSHTKSAGVVRGTHSHVPPEHWLNADLRPDEKFDVYSFSVALWEIFTENQAYASGRDRIRELVIGGTRPSLDKLPRDLPTAISVVIENCWRQEPIKRPTFSELLPRLIDITPSLRESDEFVREVLTIYHKQDKVSEHGRKMDRVSSKLSDVIRRTEQILVHLLEEKALTSQEFEEVRSQSTIHSLTRHLLDLLSSKPVASYQCFLDALIATDQQHLHKLLETDDKINFDHKTTLINNYKFLKTNIIIGDIGLLDHLKETGVLDEQELEEIQAEKTGYKRTDKLLHCIQRTSQEQYQIFLEALRMSKQEFIAEKLDEKMQEAINPVPSTLFLSKSTVVRVIHGKGAVYGIAVLSSKLFIARSESKFVEVYNADNVSATPHLLKISDERLRLPRLAACSHYDCLYVMSGSKEPEPVIYRVQLSNSSVSRWTAAYAYHCGYLFSLTNDHTVFMTLYCKVQEYTTHGELIREIKLDPSIEYPCHCIQLSDGNFVICHIGSQHRVCIVDASGRIILSYGGSPGSGDSQFNEPCGLSVDKYDHVFVADHYNNRIQLLSPALTLLGTVEIPGHQLNNPYTLHFDKINHRLYIERGSDVLVIELRV